MNYQTNTQNETEQTAKVAGDSSKEAFASKLSQGVEAARDWEKSLRVPSGTIAAALGTVLGTVTVAAFTKAWPRLKTPVVGAGYVVAGYALYKLVRGRLKDHWLDEEVTTSTTPAAGSRPPEESGEVRIPEVEAASD